MLKYELIDFIYNSNDPLNNFNMGIKYENEGQLSSAVSFYLRTAEFSEDSLLSYESLLKVSNCLEKQGNRWSSCKATLMRAISIMPNRPEAYFLLSKINEYTRDWHDSYAFSRIGENLTKEFNKSLITDVGYPGNYAFTFQRAVAAWWIGLFDESLALFRDLSKRNDVHQSFMYAILNNLNNLGNTYKTLIKYEKDKYSNLIIKFSGAKNINHNYSQAYQDMFILTMLNGKQNGTYVEIGCCDPFFNSNTALLETQFNWKGISIDINPNEIDKYKGVRKTKTLLADATKINYDELLSESTYDYLQIDCEPAAISYRILEKIPFNKCKFAIITYEHDKYIDSNIQFQEKAKKYLESYGYIRIVNNISEDRFSPFEDWYVHPDLVDHKLITKMMCISDEPKKADLYMLGKL